MANLKAGAVISKKADKTITVLVTNYKIHKIYKKRYIYSKKYLVHDLKNEAKLGDQVIISQCRPISKRKRWQLAKIVTEQPKKSEAKK